MFRSAKNKCENSWFGSALSLHSHSCGQHVVTAMHKGSEYTGSHLPKGSLSQLASLSEV